MSDIKKLILSIDIDGREVCRTIGMSDEKTVMGTATRPGPRIGEAAALYAFMSWLMSREEVAGPFSIKHQCMEEAGHLVGEFCRMCGWTVEDEWWFNKLQTRSEMMEGQTKSEVGRNG